MPATTTTTTATATMFTTMCSGGDHAKKMKIRIRRRIVVAPMCCCCFGLLDTGLRRNAFGTQIVVIDETNDRAHRETILAKYDSAK